MLNEKFYSPVVANKFHEANDSVFSSGGTSHVRNHLGTSRLSGSLMAVDSLYDVLMVPRSSLRGEYADESNVCAGNGSLSYFCSGVGYEMTTGKGAV